MTDKQAQRLARILRRTAADVEAGVKASPPTDDGAIAAVNTVDVGELLEVINQWGFIVDQPMQAHAPSTEPPVPGLTPSDPITPSGTKTISGLHITATVGNGITCTDKNANLTLTNLEVDSRDYGMWFEGKTATLTRVIFRTHGGGNDYGSRAYPTVSWRSSDCTFDNSEGHIKAAGRFIQCPDFQSTRDRFNGGRLMCGGGAANEWESEQPFKGVWKDGFVACESVQVYDKSHSTFENMDFAGTGHLYVDDGGTLILKGCKSVPEIKRKSTAGTTVTIT